MKTRIFPQDVYLGERALVESLGKSAPGNPSLLQECNDNGELIHVRIQAFKEGQPVYTEHGDVQFVQSDLQYEKLCVEIARKGIISFVVVDSVVDEQIYRKSDIAVDQVVFVRHVEYDPGQYKMHFLGQSDLRPGYYDIDAKSKWCVLFTAYIPPIDSEANIIIPFDSKVDADKFYEDHLGMSFNIWVSGMIIPRYLYDKRKQEYKNLYTFVVSEYKTKRDRYDDVAEMLPMIKTWKDVVWWRDLGTFNPLYSQEVNELLWYTVFYVEQGRAVFNLILTGKNGSGKTSCMECAARHFTDEGAIVSGTQGTRKGLEPSFYGDTPQEGYFCSPGFFKCMDELFRYPLKDTYYADLQKTTGAIKNFLQKFMEILTRKNYIVPSAKDDHFTARMTASFAAADNMIEDTRTALGQVCQMDPAVIRRLTIISLRDKDWENVKNAKTDFPGDIEYDEQLNQMFNNIIGFPAKRLRRFAEWCRKQISKVKVNNAQCNTIYRDVFADSVRDLLSKRGQLLDVGDDVMDKIVNRVDFSDHVKALVKCSTIMRIVYEQKAKMLPEQFVPIADDYETAKRLFRRIAEDSIFIYQDDIIRMMGGSSGVKRI